MGNDEGLRKMTMAEYLSFKALSSGTAHRILAESPYHAWYGSVFNPAATREDSSAMDIGTYAHAMLLEGGTDALVIVDAKDWKTKAAQEARDVARFEGKLPILARKVAEAQDMVKAAQDYIAHSEIAGIFDNGAAEQTLIWTETCDSGEVLCKARADWLTADKRICLSYKTTAGSANPDIWIRTQLPSLDLATVFYECAVSEVFPQTEETRCVHLVQEQTAPYACSLIALSPALRDLAERKRDRAIALWADCIATGYFPAYPNRICYAEPKPWQEQQFEEQEAHRAQFTDDELRHGIPA